MKCYWHQNLSHYLQIFFFVFFFPMEIISLGTDISLRTFLLCHLRDGLYSCCSKLSPCKSIPGRITHWGMKNSMSAILWSFVIWSKMERWKSWISGQLMSSPKIKKIILKFCLLLFYATTVNHFLIRLWRVTKVDLIWQLVMTSSVVGPRISSKALPQLAKICTIKRSWSLSVGLLLVWSITAFWILVKPLHLRSMLSRSVRCTENFSACSQHWSAVVF